jgi:invasion protein IalB
MRVTAARRMTRSQSMIIVAGFCAASFAVRQANAETIYSPWTKSCTGDACFINMDIYLPADCTLVTAAAALNEEAGSGKKTLRVTVPHARSGDRISIGIDGEPQLQRLLENCDAHGCVADLEAGPILIDQLKRGQMLMLDAIRADGSSIRSTLPLASFAKAYDGPPVQSPKFVAGPKKLQEELERRAQREAAAKPQPEAKPLITNCQ